MVYYGLLLLQLVFLSYIGQRNMQTLFHRLHRTIKSTSVSFYIISILYVPGTLLHELSHLFTSVLLFVQPKNINLIPKITESENSYSIRLGYVQHEKTDPFRGFLIGIAPFFVGCGFFFLVHYSALFPHPVWYLNILLFYLFFTISSTMFPSKQDLTEAIVIIPVLLIAGTLIFVLKIPIVHYLLSDEYIHVLKSLNIYLAPGTVANIGVYALFAFLIRSK